MRRLGLLVVGLWVGLGWSSGAGAVAIQWTVAESGNGHFYEAVDLGTAISWSDARALAEASGGYLATITSPSENDWVTANLLPLISGSAGSNRLGPWIGGYQDTNSPSYSEPDGGWAWVTGESWSYTNWGTPAGTNTEPNNNPVPENFLHYYVGGYSGWNDLGDFDGANLVDSYIIEVVPEPSTALLLGLGLAGMAARRRV